jgi:hypothetical protein
VTGEIESLIALAVILPAASHCALRRLVDRGNSGWGNLAMLVAGLNVAGLVINLIGVILLFRYGMPFRVRTEGASYELRGEVDQTAIAAEHRYSMLGGLGLGSHLTIRSSKIRMRQR